MTARELAIQIDGRQYRHEMTKEIVQLAKDNNLVIVYGASDDLMEMRGEIDDEFDCWNGGKFCVNKSKDKLRVSKSPGKTNYIEAVWCSDEFEGISWTYKTDIPHATFDIMEDGEKYCIGIVFSINDLK
jgi:hypothetical protein